MKFVFNQVIVQCHLKFAFFCWFAPQGAEIQKKHLDQQIPNTQCTVYLHAFDTKTAQNVGQYTFKLSVWDRDTLYPGKTSTK